MRVWSLVLLLLPAFAAFSADRTSAQGVDCAAPGSPAEEVICEEPGLLNRDRAMAERIAAITGEISDDTTLAEGLQAAQAAWREAREACLTGGDPLACMANAYDTRFADLGLLYGLAAAGEYPATRTVESFDDVPAPALDKIDAIGLCSRDGVPATSAVHDRDLGYELWIVPCRVVDAQLEVVALIMPNGWAEAAQVVRFDQLPSSGRRKTDTLTATDIDLNTGWIAAFRRGQADSNCGVAEIHVWDGRTRVRLLEVREKPDCEAGDPTPAEFPLTYRAY